ncbi:RIPOR member 3 [Saguinus oedipus]|uniref:RIPOR member 3 n=1 Tax=Saguinus oedipus TaxID=9490 RepID=A0ABQ9VPH0_SAGOE|nr:RIPOR member 3 [Saguinus oedipus]
MEQARKDRPLPPPPSLKASSRELTAGAPELDVLLMVHLQVCKALLQVAGLRDLSGRADRVCRRLLEQVVSCGGLLPRAGLPEDQTITWFQFHSYLQRQSVSDLEKHFTQLTKEVTLIEELHCTGQAKAVRKLQGKRLGQLQPLPQTLTAWALLQLDGTPKVCRAASARLAGAVRNRSFREKALLFYTNALAENDARLQQAACLALKQLKRSLLVGIESIDQIARLCQSDLEAVRAAARETTLSFALLGQQTMGWRRLLKSFQQQPAVTPVSWGRWEGTKPGFLQPHSQPDLQPACHGAHGQRLLDCEPHLPYAQRHKGKKPAHQPRSRSIPKCNPASESIEGFVNKLLQKPSAAPKKEFAEEHVALKKEN